MGEMNTDDDDLDLTLSEAEEQFAAAEPAEIVPALGVWTFADAPRTSSSVSGIRHQGMVTDVEIDDDEVLTARAAG